MGNSSSSSSAVCVRLDREAYQSGTAVSGNVYVNVHGPTGTCAALHIKVEGVEETRFRYDAGRSADGVRNSWGPQDNDIYCHGRNQFFSVTVPLQLPSKMSWKPSKADLSQLQVPFSFHLPLGIRPSFTYKGRGIEASITYTVSAVLQAERSALNWTGRLESSTPLTVYCRPPPAMSFANPILESSADGDMADCCGCCLRCPAMCLGCRSCACVKGHTWCHVGVDSSHVVNGGTLKPYAMVLNSTTVPLQCKLRLVRRVSVSGGSWQLQNSTSASITAEEQAWHHSEGPIHPDTRRMHRTSASITFPHSGSLVFPPSVHGELIQCSYELQTVVSSSNGCCGSQVRASIPVTVRTVDLSQPSPEVPSAPPLWDPVVMQQQELALPREGLIAPEAPIGIHSGLMEPLLPPRTQAFVPMHAPLV